MHRCTTQLKRTLLANITRPSHSSNTEMFAAALAIHGGYGIAVRYPSADKKENTWELTCSSATHFTEICTIVPRRKESHRAYLNALQLYSTLNSTRCECYYIM